MHLPQPRPYAKGKYHLRRKTEPLTVAVVSDDLSLGVKG